MKYCRSTKRSKILLSVLTAGCLYVCLLGYSAVAIADSDPGFKKTRKIMKKPAAGASDESESEEKPVSKFSAELSVSIVSRMGKDYWSQDPDFEDCCKPVSTGTLDVGYKLGSVFGLLTEFTDTEGAGLSDPSVGLSYEFGGAKQLSWSGVLLASIPITTASQDSKKMVGLTASIKPTWTTAKWTVSLDNSLEMDLYKSDNSADESDDTETQPETTPTDAATASPEAGRTTQIFTSTLTTEYYWRSKFATYSQLKETVTVYDPAGTVYWTELSFPGLKYRLPTVQWTLETRWSNAAKSPSAPASMSIVLGLTADTP